MAGIERAFHLLRHQQLSALCWTMGSIIDSFFVRFGGAISLTGCGKTREFSKGCRSLGVPWMPGARPGMSALREDALLARCKSVSEPVAGSVIEGNCVAARRGGEQPEVNRQSVG